MMNKKGLPHIITAVSLTVFIVLGLACATIPDGPPPTYKINTKPVAAGFLQEKKAVIFNIEMADRSSASLVERQGSGGIFSVIQGGARIARLARYNRRARAFDEANTDELKEILSMLDELVAAAWQKAYNAETVPGSYNFGKSKPKLNYFNKPNAATKKEIAAICAANNAEFAVTIVQQVRHGYMDEGSLAGTGKMVAITQIAAEICVFDKKGAVVIQASADLPFIGAGLGYGFNFTPNDGDEYAQLYLNGAGNILATILSLDSSAAITAEGLLDDIIIQLASLDDDDDDDE